MPATLDFTQMIGVVTPNGSQRNQSPNAAVFVWRLDFSKKALVTPQTAKIGTLPKGFIYTGCEPILRTAQGGTSTLNIGTSADPDGFRAGSNLNAGTDVHAGGSAGAITVGTFFASATEVWVEFASGTISVAVLDVVVRGILLPR